MPASRPGTGRLAAPVLSALGATVVFAPGAEAATFTVDSLADGGAGSLRRAVADAQAAPGADTIEFDSGLTGQIVLTTGQIDYGPTADGLTIDGPGADRLAVSGNDASRILELYGQGGPVVELSGLTLTDGAAADGGAIRNLDTRLRLDGVTVTGNAATGDGGAIHTDGFNSGLEIRDSTLSGNRAGADGGAIYGEDTGSGSAPRVLISDTTVSGNTAGDDGGGIYFYDPDGPVRLERTELSANTAVDDGGGIALYDTDGGGLTIDASLLTGNTARDGGGIALYEPDDPTTIVNTTVTGNSATGTGGGVRIDASADTTTIRGATIAGNAGPVGSNLDTGSPVVAEGSVLADGTGSADLAGTGGVTVADSLVEDAGTAAVTGTPLTGDPELGPLADNAGPTRTLLPAPSSVLRDAGGSHGLTTDQRGLTRPVGGAADIGAVELRNPVVAGVSPSGAAPGTTVTVTGSGFTGATAVDFGSASASSFTVVDDATITVVVPAGTGTVDVRVRVAEATSATAAAARFSYATAPAATPTPTASATVPTPTPTPTPPTPRAETATPTPQVPAVCVSLRRFTARYLHLRRGERVRRAVVVRDGRVARRLRATRRSVRVDLRGLERDTYAVRITICGRAGATRVLRRTYRTCVQVP